MADSECFVSLLTNNSFFLGLRVMAYSLRKSGATRKLCVLVTPNVSDQHLRDLEKDGCDVIVVDPIANPYSHTHVDDWVDAGM